MKFVLEYIKRYKVTYISILIIFLIGIVLGGMILVRIPELQKEEVKKYIIDSVTNSQNNGIDKTMFFKKSIIENIKFAGILYLLGCTIIASFTIYIAIAYKGFIFGYTGAAILMSFGIGRGIKYIFLVLILHNIIYLPIVFLLATSGIRIYKEIMKKTINFKIELLRHTIIMLLCMMFGIISSAIESYFSTIIFEFL